MLRISGDIRGWTKVQPPYIDHRLPPDNFGIPSLSNRQARTAPASGLAYPDMNRADPSSLTAPRNSPTSPPRRPRRS